ncbi:hypothetical protein LXL04_020916 [Taraxacum kok-saghyz]
MAPLAELKRALRESQPRLLCLTLLNPRPPSSTSNKLLGRRPRSTGYRIRSCGSVVRESRIMSHILPDMFPFSGCKSPFYGGVGAPLPLDGTNLKLISVKINGNELKTKYFFFFFFQEGDYHVDARYLVVKSPPSGNFILETVTEILPQKNTSLEDRPDIMAKFTCRIEADKSLYIVLLSNGNLIEQGDLEGGKHFAHWEDPFKKPCYLFALVAGQLESRDDTFTTCSGRKVALRIWTPPQDIPKTEHAMYSLKACIVFIYISCMIV